MNRRSLVIALVAALVLVGGIVWWALAREGAEPAPPGEATATGEPTTQDPATEQTTSEEPTAEDPATTPEPTATADPTAEPTATPTADPTADPTAPPVDLEEPAGIGALTARLARIEAIEGEADGPGEIAGPALRVTVELTNGGAAEADLTGVVVNLYHGPDAAPAEMLAGSGSDWLEGSLAPGATVTGVYVFTVPADDRVPVQVTVFVTPDEPTVLFEGAL